MAYKRTEGFHCMLCDCIFTSKNLNYSNHTAFAIQFNEDIKRVKIINFCDYCTSRGDLGTFHTFNQIAYGTDPGKLTIENIQTIEQTKINRYKYVQSELSRYMVDDISLIIIEYYACVRKFVMED
jgi:hypothetical protein